jgi:hypothetical protein
LSSKNLRRGRIKKIKTIKNLENMKEVHPIQLGEKLYPI